MRCAGRSTRHVTWAGAQSQPHHPDVVGSMNHGAFSGRSDGRRVSAVFGMARRRGLQISMHFLQTQAPIDRREAHLVHLKAWTNRQD